MSKFESIHTFKVHRTSFDGVKVTDSYHIEHGLLVALYAMSKLADDRGYHTHKVTAIKYLRVVTGMHLREAKYIVELIWEKFALQDGKVAYQEESYYVTYDGVEDAGPFVSE